MSEKHTLNEELTKVGGDEMFVMNELLNNILEEEEFTYPDWNLLIRHSVPNIDIIYKVRVDYHLLHVFVLFVEFRIKYAENSRNYTTRRMHCCTFSNHHECNGLQCNRIDSSFISFYNYRKRIININRHVNEQ